MSVISIRNVTKKFRGSAVFDNVSMEFEEGRTYAVVGPNGSGKSVLLKLMCGLTVPDRGTVSVDPRFLSIGRTFPESFGITIDGPAYLPNRTAEQNLLQLAAIQNVIGTREVREAMVMVGLHPGPRQKVRAFSMGMKQKLSLAQAFMENPEVLLLDEPFNALDADSIVRIKEILFRFKSSGKTIVFTSHSPQDVNDLSDQVFEIANTGVRTRA